MTAARSLLRTRTPLGAIARPAGRRPAINRFAYSVCLERDVQTTAERTGLLLDAMTGPTRCTVIRVHAFRGDQARAALAELVRDHGQDEDAVGRVAGAFLKACAVGEQLADDSGPVLLVAHCRALWNQSRRSAVWS